MTFAAPVEKATRDPHSVLPISEGRASIPTDSPTAKAETALNDPPESVSDPTCPVWFEDKIMSGELWNSVYDRGDHKSITPAITDQSRGDSFIDECFRIDFKELVEDRSYYNIDGLKTLNTIVYSRSDPARALKMTVDAVSRCPDFDVLYVWLGDVRAQLREKGQPQKTYLEGLQRCRQKKYLCASMGNAEFKSGNLAQAIIWWIRSCLLKTPEPYPYLNLACIAEGVGLNSEYRTLIRKADSLSGSVVRFNSAGVTERRQMASSQGSSEIASAITRLCRGELARHQLGLSSVALSDSASPTSDHVVASVLPPRHLLFQGTRFRLFTDEQDFAIVYKNTRQAALEIDFAEYYNVLRRFHANVPLYDDKLYCEKCFTKMSSMQTAFPNGCPKCSYKKAVILMDSAPIKDVTEQDLTSIREMWRAHSPIAWENDPKFVNSDKWTCNCFTEIPRGEGYFTGSDLRCEKCAMKSTAEEILPELLKDPFYFGRSEIRRARNFAAGSWNFEAPLIEN
jgi:hypothetical protein